MLFTCFTILLKVPPMSLTRHIISWTIGFIIAALFALTQYRILGLEEPQSRKIKPLSVWLTVIPYASALFQFYFTKHVADSIARQLSISDHQIKKHPTLAIGLIYCCINLVFSVIDLISRFTSYENRRLIAWITLLWLISFITYWVRLGAFKRKLQANNRLTAQPMIAP